MRVFIGTSALRAVANCAADKDMRFYLNGVNVEASKSETLLVASDGSILGVHRNKHENEVEGPISFIIPIDIVKQIKGGKTSLDILTLESSDAKTWELRGADKSGTSIAFKPVDAKFIDWRRVLPAKKPSREAVQFNPELLLRFLKASKELGLFRFPRADVAYDGFAAAGVDVGCENFYGVVMPLRDDIAPWDGAPGWVKEAVK